MGRAAVRLQPWSRAGAGAVACALLCGAPPAAVAEPGAPPEAAVEEVERRVREARFEDALARADALRDELGAAAAQPDSLRLRVRLEVAAGTAQIALGREDAARECLRRALAAEPALDLDRDATSPKVLRVFDLVRSELRPAP